MKTELKKTNEKGNLVAVKDKQPPQTGNYEITRDGEKFWNCHFDTYFGWAHLLNPELYYWRELNKEK